MTSNRVYTLTFHEVINVGAVLQAYALQQFLHNSGFECEILNYRPRYFLWQIYRPAKSLRRAVEKYRQLLKFRKFRRNHMLVTSRSFQDISGLPGFDDGAAIVCGSDQIWNRRLTGGRYDPVFFLGTPLNSRKIAYGGSAGGHRLSPDRDFIESHLREFHAIGTREEFLMEDLVRCGVVPQATTVLDPSFLIRDYSQVIDTRYVPKDLKYIASYEVSDDDTRADFQIHVQKIKKKLGLPVVHLGAKPIDGADVTISCLGPGEWLGLLAGAEMVCTNSFHGVALSINLERGLVFIPHLDSEKNARALGMLSRIGLEQLIYRGVDNLVDDHCRYSTVQMAEQVQASQSFLLEALS